MPRYIFAGLLICSFWISVMAFIFSQYSLLSVTRSPQACEVFEVMEGV